MDYQITEINFDEASEYEDQLSQFVLWYSDLEEAGVDEVWIAKSNDSIVGFLTKNIDGDCVAIEVAEDLQGNGIASSLCEEAWCFDPEDDQCPEFWEKMSELRESL